VFSLLENDVNLNKLNRDGSTLITAVTNDRLATNTTWLLLRLMFYIYFHPKTYTFKLHICLYSTSRSLY
jgi:hypothetical protein